ncbi:MAG: hypothetical protein SAK29_07190 [Scytonema sp. PMC 1069.18]|nr:hypothetical protein [Scytonema sp. PMC 1069.18]MEC4883081.1 hypothetical protein [Scytonema sp. PMC 1070.18]
MYESISQTDSKPLLKRFIAMSNFNNSLNNSQSSQDDKNPVSEEVNHPSREMYRLVLQTECKSRDLIALRQIGKLNGAEVSDIMPIVGLSNPATNVFLRKLGGDQKYGGFKIPLLRREKGGTNGSYKHFLNHGLTLEDIEAVMTERGMSAYKTDISNTLKTISTEAPRQQNVISQEEITEELLPKEVDSLNSYIPFDIDKQPDNLEFEDIDQEVENSNTKLNLSKSIPISEVLKIVQAATSVVVQQFNKKIAEQNARIAKLEEHLALLQDSPALETNVINDEVLDTVRFTVLSQFQEFSPKQNGKTLH